MVKQTSACCQTSLAKPKPFQASGYLINLYHFQGGEIATKRVFEDTDYSVKFEFEQVQQVLSLLTVGIGLFVLCSYEGHKLFGMACEVNTAHKDIEIKFMHPLCPNRSYCWLRCDVCWLLITNIFFSLKTQSLTTGIGRQYYLHNDNQKYIQDAALYMMSINTVTNLMFIQQIK